MKITADFTQITGKIKPMHGGGQPPFSGSNFSLFKYMTAAHMPYSRLHDVGGWLGQDLYVDIPNLFRDFDADENDPASYDFAFTDRMLKAIADAGVEPFFRLGITIENSWDLKAYRTAPPKDPAKWARICEHIVRHYNEGWANGLHLGITYWEIWNEPEQPAMWAGTPEQYFELYEVTANHLKKCFGDSIKVGGYASCGFYARAIDPTCDGKNIVASPTATAEQKLLNLCITYAHRFFDWITSAEHHAPIDFFSWHTYTDVGEAVAMAEYARKILDNHGLNHVESILNEWNTTPGPHAHVRAEGRLPAIKAASMLLALQKSGVYVACYYDTRLGPSVYGGLFNPDTWTPYLTYYPFLSFGTAYALGKEVKTETDGQNVYLLGATDESGKHGVLLIVNRGDAAKADLEITGIDTACARITRIDEEYDYRYTGEALGNTITLPEDSFVEILF